MAPLPPLNEQHVTLQPHGDSLGNGFTLFDAHPLALEEGGQHEVEAGDAGGAVEQSYLLQVEVSEEVAADSQCTRVQICPLWGLFFGEVYVLHKGHVIDNSSQQHSHAFAVHNSVHLLRPYHYSAEMGVPLGGYGESGRHASIAECLWVGQVATAFGVDKIGLPAERRHALATRLSMLALCFECLEVVAEFLVLEHVLAAFADLVFGVHACSWMREGYLIVVLWAGSGDTSFGAGVCTLVWFNEVASSPFFPCAAD